MTTGVPEISEGAEALLRIALANDTQRAIANNAALLVALDYLKRIPAACRAPSNAQLADLLDTKELPPAFVGITCRLLECVRDRLDARFRDADSSRSVPVVTDFDRLVLQALAETLADAAWPERAANDFDGPTAAQVRRRLAASEIEKLFEALIRNYLANILQDYFAAARVRETVRNLAPDTEAKLRSEDASIVASHILMRACLTRRPPDSAELLLELWAVLRAVSEGHAL